jgi:hypothetical protein
MKKHATNEVARAALVSVMKEMTTPLMSKSAREAGVILAAARIALAKSRRSLAPLHRL